MENKLSIDNLPKNVPFTVPKDYFDTLNKNINNKIDLIESGKSEGNKILTINWKKWSLAVAACLSIFFGINWWSNHQTLKQSENAIAKIDNSQIIKYLKNENVEIADLKEYNSITNKEIQNLLIEEINIKDIENDKDLDLIDL